MGWGPFNPEFIDTFFNGRPAKKTEPQPPVSRAITIEQLIARKTSTVRYGKVYYKIVVTEVEKP